MHSSDIKSSISITTHETATNKTIHCNQLQAITSSNKTPGGKQQFKQSPYSKINPEIKPINNNHASISNSTYHIEKDTIAYVPFQQPKNISANTIHAKYRPIINSNTIKLAPSPLSGKSIKSHTIPSKINENQTANNSVYRPKETIDYRLHSNNNSHGISGSSDTNAPLHILGSNNSHHNVHHTILQTQHPQGIRPGWTPTSNGNSLNSLKITMPSGSNISNKASAVEIQRPQTSYGIQPSNGSTIIAQKRPGIFEPKFRKEKILKDVDDIDLPGF
jgi:hypothetical protein